MKVTIDNKEYELKYSFRALMIYENITKKSFNPKSLTEILVFFYSIVCASVRDNTVDFDEFMDMLDSHPEMIQDFSEWLVNVMTVQSGLSPKLDENKVPEENTKN